MLKILEEPKINESTEHYRWNLAEIKTVLSEIYNFEEITKLNIISIRNNEIGYIDKNGDIRSKYRGNLQIIKTTNQERYDSISFSCFYSPKKCRGIICYTEIFISANNDGKIKII